MIPQRTLRSDAGVNLMRERVAACRKRLRDHRGMQTRTIANELPAESESKGSFLDAVATMRESLGGSKLSSTAPAGSNNAYEMLSSLGSHEVGIT